nr:hypothetical protein [Thermotogota bacterium]
QRLASGFGLLFPDCNPNAVADLRSRIYAQAGTKVADLAVQVDQHLATDTFSGKDLVTLLTGVVEVVGGLLGVTIISFSQALLPYMMAFAAGAMIFVIGDEVIPESHLNGHQRLATYSLIIGFFIMSALDVALG